MGVSLSWNNSCADSTLSRCSAASDDSLRVCSVHGLVFKAVETLKDKLFHYLLFRQRGSDAVMRVSLC